MLDDYRYFTNNLGALVANLHKDGKIDDAKLVADACRMIRKLGTENDRLTKTVNSVK